jgi:hypothetical protein
VLHPKAPFERIAPVGRDAALSHLSVTRRQFTARSCANKDREYRRGRQWAARPNNRSHS